MNEPNGIRDADWADYWYRTLREEYPRVTYPLKGNKTMLKLMRRIGETLFVGDDVTITILGVRGNQVKLGINAPKEIPVHREEIYERIKQQEEKDYGHNR